jgi:hypothetical protein
MFCLEVSVLRLANNSEQQQQQQQHSHKQPTNQKTPSSFKQSFIFSGKQEGRATDLGEGHGIVTRETCITLRT